MGAFTHITNQNLVRPTFASLAAMKTQASQPHTPPCLGLAHKHTGVNPTLPTGLFGLRNHQSFGTEDLLREKPQAPNRLTRVFIHSRLLLCVGMRRCTLCLLIPKTSIRIKKATSVITYRLRYHDYCDAL